MIPWAPGRPGPAPEDPWQPGTARRLETIERILDESRDLLDTAMERNTGVERSLRRAEYQTRDLQWDAAKILLDQDSARPAIRTVQAGGDQLLSDLRHTQAQAEDLRDTLRQARRHLEHATPLVTQLTGATTDPEHAVAAAMLATRLERLNTLVELATPLAERTSTRIEQAHQTLTAGLKQTEDRTTGLYPNRDFHRGEPVGQPGTAEVGGRRLAAVRSDGRVWCPAGESGDRFALYSRLSTVTYAAGINPPTEARVPVIDTPGYDTFHQFWNLDRGIFNTAREISDARISATHGGELTEHAVNATAVTAAHTRDMQRRPGHTPPPTRHLPLPRVGSTGSDDRRGRAGRPSHLGQPARKETPMPAASRSRTRRPPDRRPPDRRPPTGRPTRRLSIGHGTNPPGAGGPLWPVDVLEELEILDALAERVSGDMINAGIATIDTLWTDGQDLQRPLATYRSLALRASPQYTAGLWTLVAWIHWRTGNRAEAWPALHLAMKIDVDIDAAHY